MDVVKSLSNALIGCLYGRLTSDWFTFIQPIYTTSVELYISKKLLYEMINNSELGDFELFLLFDEQTDISDC